MRVEESILSTNSELEDGLLTRWQKRKQNVLKEKQDLLEQDELSEVSPPEEAVKLSDTDMPPLETLNADSDYKGFMSPDVSEALRKLALRKLFHGANLNLCDGLDVYDGDYTSFTKLGNVITADIAHHLERAAKAKLESSQEAETVENSESLAKDDGDIELQVDTNKKTFSNAAPVIEQPVQALTEQEEHTKKEQQIDRGQQG